MDSGGGFFIEENEDEEEEGGGSKSQLVDRPAPMLGSDRPDCTSCHTPFGDSYLFRDVLVSILPVRYFRAEDVFLLWGNVITDSVWLLHDYSRGFLSFNTVVCMILSFSVQ